MATAPYTTLISVEALAARLAAPAGDSPWVILDARHRLSEPGWGASAYAVSHLPGAQFVAVDGDLSAPTNGHNGRHPLPAKATFAATLSRWGIAPGRQVVVYDEQQGMFAARLWWMLRWAGFDDCAVLDGGFARWQAAGLPLCSTACAAPSAAGTFVPCWRDLAVDVSAVLANLETPAMTLLDARAASRFRGEGETLDPVGGHIPGALNRPFTNNLEADGTFKPAAQLRAEFSALLAGTPSGRVVHQCGSGITACHNALAMEIAGLAGTRLYPGSWSEWCSDPSRPVARG